MHRCIYVQACKDFDNNGTCVTQCPPASIYDPNLFRLVPNPNHRLSAGALCVVECPSESVQCHLVLILPLLRVITV